MTQGHTNCHVRAFYEEDEASLFEAMCDMCCLPVAIMGSVPYSIVPQNTIPGATIAWKAIIFLLRAAERRGEVGGVYAFSRYQKVEAHPKIHYSLATLHQAANSSMNRVLIPISRRLLYDVCCSCLKPFTDVGRYRDRPVRAKISHSLCRRLRL